MPMTDEQLSQYHANAEKRANITHPKPITVAIPAPSEADHQRETKRVAREAAEKVASLAQDELTQAKWGETIPKRYRAHRLSDFGDGAQDAVMEFLDGSAWALFLHGGLGCGKTSLAAAAIWAWIEQKHTRPLFVPAYRAARWFRDLDNCRENADRMAKAPLLVVDDVGSNRSTPHVVEQLLFIIQERYDNVLPTIVISNDTLDKFSSDLDKHGRAGSRLRQGLVVHMSGKDRRTE